MGISQQRVAIVTGGTTGIGFASAKQLLVNGYRVAIFSQHAGKVAEAHALLAGEFGENNVYAGTVDLRQVDAIATFFAEVASRWQPPTVIVCNAGISPKRNGRRVAFDQVSLDEWNDVLSVNLTGTMLCCQLAAPGMVSAGFGRIILIGSVAARTLPRIAGSAYVTSKAALAGLARVLVGELSEHGITINTIAPGRILTDMTGPADSVDNRAAIARIPSNRLGHPDDIAAVVVFLASVHAGFVNGAIIDVNGGEFTPV